MEHEESFPAQSVCRAGFFMLGAASMLGQALLIRQFLTAAYGNELCLGLFLFWWFLGVGLGALGAGRWAPRVKDRVGCFAALLVVWLLVLGIQLVVVRTLRFWVGVKPGEYIPLGRLMLGAGLGAFPFSFFIGFLFPFASQLARYKQPKSSSGVSIVYILEAAGSLIAGLLFTYLFLTRVDAYQLWKWLAVAGAIVSLLLLLTAYKRLRWRSVFDVAVLALLILFLLVPSGWLEQITTNWRWRVGFPQLSCVESVESPYGQLDLAEQAEQYSLYCSGQLVSTFPDPYMNLEPVHCAMVQHGSPEQVLLVGGSPEMLPLILSYGVKRVDWLELDPVQLELMLKYLPAKQRKVLEDPRVRLQYGDGRWIIRQSEEKYDIILLNVPDPSTAQLNRYYTEEFYREAKRALRPGGVLVTSIEASVQATGEEVVGYGGIIFRTLQKLFSEVAIQPGQTYRFFACDSPGQVTENPTVMAKRFRQHGATPEGFVFAFESLFPPDQVMTLRTALEHDPQQRINTDLHPAAYLYQLLLWNQLAGSDLSDLWLLLRNRSPLWMLMLAALVLLSAALILLGKDAEQRLRFKVGFAVAVMGLTGMATELILLLGFQNVFGVLYQKIALFVALFMMGLTLGGFFSHRWMERRWTKIPQKRNALIFLLSVTTVFVLLVPVAIQFAALSLLGGALLFYLLAAAAGFLTGMGFPLSVGLYHREGEPIARAAGVVDSMDHLGAMFGALLCGTLWLPLWGVWASCLIIAGANGLALVLFNVWRGSRGR